MIFKKSLTLAPVLHVNQSFTDANGCKKAQLRVRTCANIPRALPQTQKRQVANDPLASRVPTGSVCARLRKTTGLNLLSRFHWVKLREWRESYFTDRMRWGFRVKGLMETSKLTWWDNYKGEQGWGGGGFQYRFNHLTVSATAAQWSYCK